MLDRRKFLTSGALCTGAAAIDSQSALADEPARKNTSGVGGYEYRLPAFKTGNRLLFQGDSITDMKWGRNQKDRNHYLGHSYVYLIAARLGVDLPEAQLDIYNRGMSGHKVSDLKKRWQKDAIDMKPDLLSILIGVNDRGQLGGNSENFKTWETDYRGLLNQSRKANPELRLVLLEPFVLASGRLQNKAAFKATRAVIDQQREIVAQLAKDYDAVHIRTQKIFDDAAKSVSAEQWIWDGVHPLPQGHELIARNWLQEVSLRWS